jgi:DNA-directed RNA polymerase beta subunit
MTHLLFLQTLPEEKEPTNKIIINGEEYFINFMEKIKTGEYVAADMAMKSDKHDYASFLAILCRKKGEIYDSNFEADKFEERRKMFEEQPVTNILPVIGFFLSLYAQLQTPFLLYTKVEEAINHIQQNIDNLDKIGPFRRFYMNWQMKKLRKLLESASNTSQTHSHSLHTSLKKAKWKKKKMRSSK